MSFTAPSQIDLGAFADGTDFLTPALCANLAEAAVVCLEQQGHAPQASMAVGPSAVKVLWPPADGRAAGSHADPQEATEEGAVAIAIELIRGGTGLDVVRRSRKGTGFDYHLGPRASASPFEGSSCLEVSGILDEDERLLARRADEKLRQAVGGGAGLPGFAIVVGFAGPRAAVRSFG
jgi:hypothetical protein